MANILRAKREVTQKNEQKPMLSPVKLQLLFTIVAKEKTEFYVDLLQSFDVNIQLILSGQGTANEKIIELMGLANNDKSVIISTIRRNRVKEALDTLEEKFNTVKNGKGIAYTVPMSSTIGVAIYQFLSNTTGGNIK